MEKKPTGSPPVNPIVASLECASDFESIVRMEGYVGSTTSGRVRLYEDLGLKKYVEFKKEDVLHFVDVPDDRLGRTMLFVRASARVNVVRVESSAAGDVSSPYPPPFAASDSSPCGQLTEAYTLLFYARSHVPDVHHYPAFAFVGPLIEKASDLLWKGASGFGCHIPGIKSGYKFSLGHDHM